MYYRRKLRPDKNISGFIIIPVIGIMLMLFAYVIINISAVLVVGFMTFILYSAFSLIAYIRTRNNSYLASSLFQLFMAIYFATVPMGFIPFEDKRVSWFFYLCGISVAIWLVYLIITRKAKWKGREIFELAASSIDISGNGFTERPMPTGKVSYSTSELMGFADFLRRNLIAVPYIDDEAVVFVPVRMGQEFGIIMGTSKHYFQKTWIAFKKDGNVSVNISKSDYQNYVDELSFDKLCESMGKLFIKFFEYYKKGDEIRILSNLEDLKTNIFY